MIRLLLVDDQNLICQGFKAMLELEPDLQIVGIANDGQAAIEQVAELQPDLVLMDVQMPVVDGRAATRVICQRYPNVKVIVLSTFDDDEYIADSMRAGAKGYLLKDMPADELVQAIRLAHRGYAQFGPGLIEKLLPAVSALEKAHKPLASKMSVLTSREQDVLNLICDGSTNREIAQRLHISEGTVKTYVTRMLERLGLRNRAQLAIFANTARTAQELGAQDSTGKSG